ncbi:four helix bundle protein [Chryseobacterium sp. PMSZPI]|uniref:four helix bundle protein n=1 Tax=Chryseobacterium sp. PMSZPI TaxID=1033900 RepID=UPI000C33891E|nr:four helix bundle protein [Chryseobacterium sp. PMSZPI]PKF74119.1 four helix bundle protein [Chryseobacterium sp. PMSZPI]
MGTIQRFEDLEIWKLSRELCNEVYQIIESTNLKTNFKLCNQIDSSSGSVMDNIAEALRGTEIKNLFNFFPLQKASCGETRSQLYRVFDRKFISQEKFEKLIEQTETLSKKINSFIKHLNTTDLKGTKYKR